MNPSKKPSLVTAWPAPTPYKAGTPLEQARTKRPSTPHICPDKILRWDGRGKREKGKNESFSENLRRKFYILFYYLSPYIFLLH